MIVELLPADSALHAVHDLICISCAAQALQHVEVKEAIFILTWQDFPKFKMPVGYKTLAMSVTDPGLLPECFMQVHKDLCTFPCIMLTHTQECCMCCQGIMCI